MKQARVYINNITYPNLLECIFLFRMSPGNILFRMNLIKALFRMNLDNKNRVLCLRVAFFYPTMFKSAVFDPYYV